jgi:hypothetical protein
MFCPKCGAQNDGDMKFCRACGENLTVISQAMSKHLPVILASKLDNYLEQKNERIRRDGVMTGLSGLFLLLSGILQVTLSAGGWPAVFMFAGAFILLTASMWDTLVYKRSLSQKRQAPQLSSATETNELKHYNPGEIPPPSVAESTTRQLDVVLKNSGQIE